MLFITRYDRDSSSCQYHNLGALARAVATNTDMVSLPVRVTSDKKLVLSAHSSIGTKQSLTHIRSSSLKQIRRAASGSEQPLVTLEETLNRLYGKTFLEIEIYEWSSVSPIVLLIKNYAKRKSDWSSLLIASENPLLLLRVRKLAPHALLCLKHRRYPLTFISWHPILQLSAVGFRRLHTSSIAIEAARKLDLLIYVYTINRKKSLKNLERYGIDAIVTNTPERFT
ncbi:glycerophosphodiester phosphodiesterase [Candidatus Saccharibacteria bacterium]|nr:glycerophosphodiester phosphodiesterase [Candidatus Saccharibacteria bacterium]NCU40223.1 glycerophosphodiester phosphodiesterase [Candidatus Saccharibacteria bacterium]